MKFGLEFNIQGQLDDGRKYVNPEMAFTFEQLPAVLKLLEQKRREYPYANMSIVCQFHTLGPPRNNSALKEWYRRMGAHRGPSHGQSGT